MEVFPEEIPEMSFWFHTRTHFGTPIGLLKKMLYKIAYD